MKLETKRYIHYTQLFQKYCDDKRNDHNKLQKCNTMEPHLVLTQPFSETCRCVFSEERYLCCNACEGCMTECDPKQCNRSKQRWCVEHSSDVCGCFKKIKKNVTIKVTYRKKTKTYKIRIKQTC